jgi:hypothetical protein
MMRKRFDGQALVVRQARLLRERDAIQAGIGDWNTSRFHSGRHALESFVARTARGVSRATLAA